MGNSNSFGSRNNASVVNTNCNSSGCNECGCENFNVEISDEVSYDNYAKGVSFTTLGDKVMLNYNGSLAQSGTNQIFAVVDFGDNSNVQNGSTYPMNNTNQRMFELSIPARQGGMLKVAFKDNSGNWDNNSGKNYSYYIQ